MKIIFSGIERYSKILIDSLKKKYPQNTYLYINIKATFNEKLNFYYQILNTDILFVTYVDTFYIHSVDIALLLNKKIILLWVGTDVMDAIPYIRKGLFNNNYIQKVTHVTASRWLAKELSSVGINAKYLPNFIFKKINRKYKKVSCNNKFIILTRIAKNREKFYGIDIIIKLAQDFPNFEFRIVGIENYNVPINIKNIRFLGWKENMEEEYQKCSVFVRYMKHDGESHAVLEALSYGKTVFYNYKFPYVNYVKNYEELKKGLINAFDKFKNKELLLNYKSINFIENNYNIDRVVSEYYNLFKTIKKKDLK
jgi:hypothetical protein